MDAKVDDWVVTPRTGKPVEANALRIMAEFARLLGEPHERYEALAQQARAGFARFWNEKAGHCYDVLDGPAGNDPALRPNQLFAVSLPHSPRGCIAQAWTVAEVLRTWMETADGGQPDRADCVGEGYR